MEIKFPLKVFLYDEVIEVWSQRLNEYLPLLKALTQNKYTHFEPTSARYKKKNLMKYSLRGHNIKHG